MAETELLEELFGADDDDDGDVNMTTPAPATTTGDDSVVKNDDAQLPIEPTDDVAAAVAGELTQEALFGADSDEDGGDDVAMGAAGGGDGGVVGDGVGGDEDDDNVRTAGVDAHGNLIVMAGAQGEPYNVIGAPLARPGVFAPPTRVATVILPKSVAIEPTPFDPATYKPPTIDPKTGRDQYGRAPADMSVDTVIRWRIVEDEMGHLVRQSNARVIKWADGASHMFIGDIAFKIEEHTVAGDLDYLIAECAAGTNESGGTLHRVIAPVFSQITLKPANIRTSKLATKIRNLTKAREQQKPKMRRSHADEAVITDKSQRLQMERQDDARQRRVQRARSKRERPSSSSRDQQKLTSSFLEAGNDDDDEDDDDGDGDGDGDEDGGDDDSEEGEDYNPFKRPPEDGDRLLSAQTSAPAVDGDDDDDDDEDDEEILTKRAPRRRRGIMNDDDDDGDE